MDVRDGNYVFAATDFVPWKCPACLRTMQIFANRTMVFCCGGWILTEPVLIPWHEGTRCYRIPEDEADPLTLAEAMGILEKENVDGSSR